MSTINLSGLLGTGFRGDSGFTGSRGDIGFAGSQGGQGDIGFTGSKGTAAPRSIILESPSNSEKVVMFFTTSSFTISEIRSVLFGSSSPSATFSIRYGTDVSASGTEVVTSGITVTNTTTGLSTTSFTNATVPVNNFVWIQTTAISGNVTSLHVSIFGDI